MNKSKIYLYIIYAIVALVFLILASCANEDLAAGEGQGGGRMSLGIQVLQNQEAPDSRAASAPAIKSYQMKTSDGKPVYAQMSSEAYIEKHLSPTTNEAAEESRGVSVTSDTFYERFGLFYYLYNKMDSWDGIVSAGTESPTLSNFAVEKSAGWLTDKYWPGADHKLTFMAYAPYDNDYKDASGTKYIQLSTDIKGYPSLTYTVPDKVEEQQDLLVSAEPNTQDMQGDYNKVIGMKFYHTLSAINFKIGSVMAPGRIAKIELKGVYNRGHYDFGTREWTNLSGSANYSIAPNYIVDKQRGVVFTGVDDTKNDLFLVMPQTVPDGAKIVVTIEDGANFSSSHEMELPIGGHEWLSGYTITYTLSTAQENSDYIFSVSKINSIDKDATTVNYKVSSFVQSYYGSQTPVGWTAKYAVDDDIDIENYSSETGEVVKSGFIFDMATPTATTSSLQTAIRELEPPVSNASSNKHTEELRLRSEVGSEGNPHDLSMVNGTRSTANAYVINAPGYYKIPIVYGNAIKQGNDNAVAYGKESTVQTQFLNHLDKRIVAPYIIDNGIDLKDAVLVWQDAYKMIDTATVKMSADKKFICFKVDKDYISQGNALLAVRDADSKVCWSWHIWVTDKDLSPSKAVAVTNYQLSVYNFMPVPLGFCDEDTRTYKPRRIAFQFVQEESGNIATVSFDQITTAVQEYGMNAPFYLFGNNIPTRIAAGNDNKTWKTLYLGSTDFSLGKYPGNYVTRGYAIQHPCYSHSTNSSAWLTPQKIVYLWDANNVTAHYYDKSTQTSEKTIYDPCPYGYKVPEPAAFTGFTTNGANQTSASKLNVYGSYAHGWNVYTQSGKQGDLFFIPALGYLTVNMVLSYSDGTAGYYWTCGSHPTTAHSQAYRFYLTKSAMQTNASAYRANNFNVFPVADD